MTPYTFQICIDAHEPHTLADWWAEAIGWEVESQDEDFIRRMIAEGHATEQDTLTHRGRLVWRAGAAILHPDPDFAAPRVLFQEVPEEKTVKNRVHVDLRTGPADEAALQRLEGLGATRIGSGRQGPHSWTILADPEGNEFCL